MVFLHLNKSLAIHILRIWQRILRIGIPTTFLCDVTQSYLINMEKTSQLIKESRAEINIELSKQARHGVIEILNQILCDENILYIKTKNYHWNVIGPDFSERHAFFREQYETLDETIDEVAERIRDLNGKSLGTYSEYLEHGRLKESPGEYPNDITMISNLLADHEKVIRSLRKDADRCEDEYHDMGTNDFLIGLMKKHEKMAWMLRAHQDKG
jgi:starvation-inducible DNA-binding protein